MSKLMKPVSTVLTDEDVTFFEFLQEHYGNDVMIMPVSSLLKSLIRRDYRRVVELKKNDNII